MSDKITQMNNYHLAKTRLLQWQPTAMYIRLEKDACPDCKLSDGFVSYQLPQDLPGGEWHHERGDGMESCGFWCSRCDWSNAGSRPIDES